MSCETDFCRGRVVLGAVGGAVLAQLGLTTLGGTTCAGTVTKVIH